MDCSTRDMVKVVGPLLMQHLLRPLAGKHVVRFNATRALADRLQELGFRMRTPQEFGPPGGRQLFFVNGLVTVRVKTKGDKAGPRANQPHLSVALTDGHAGNAWFNDLAKLNAFGQLAAKSITTPERFRPIDHDGKGQRFVMIQGGRSLTEFGAEGIDRLGDAWADRTHFRFADDLLTDDLPADL